jgi:uncharacterized protein (TIGR02058 family)
MTSWISSTRRIAFTKKIVAINIFNRAPARRCFLSQWTSDIKSLATRPAWSEEWRKSNLGATLYNGSFPSNLFFVQLGFGVDQHGDRTDATKAAIRAVRNSIEFNSIPGVIEHIPGGRKEMMIHVKLGIPNQASVDFMEVAKVFPYGRLLPIETSVGGLEFATGRVVEELGDQDDIGVCVVACVSIGYDKHEDRENSFHNTYSTKDGF